ncbi:MAG: HAMP domain-containing sensor histidine kinase [Mongoliitalea sp.]
MNLKIRITLWFTALTVLILVIFMGIIYFSAYQNRLSEFYEILEKEAITKANLLLDTSLDAETLQTIYRKNKEILYEVEVAIYNDAEELIYHDAVDIDFVKETPEMFEAIRRSKQLKFLQENWQVLGFVYEFDDQKYLITSAAYDYYGYNKLQNVRDTMIISLLLGLVLLVLLGFYFSKRMLSPVSEMIVEAELISASNLHLRLRESANKDELNQLAQTFNKLLERLERSFDSQKQFVSYVAHEVRTPLAAMITELEWVLQKDRNLSEYQSTIENILQDSHKLSKLTSDLLDFAKANYDRSEVRFKETRIDEVLLEASQQVQQENPDYKIDIEFGAGFEDQEVSLEGNEYLLVLALKNLIHNACKFSKEKNCQVAVDVRGLMIQVTIKDQGIGIPQKELSKIFDPFFRGTNKSFSKGSGIGLTLVKKIIDLHEGSIEVQSNVGKGTSINLQLRTM